jgi:hypothetical protein
MEVAYELFLRWWIHGKASTMKHETQDEFSRNLQA